MLSDFTANGTGLFNYTPEPSSMALLGIAGGMMLRHRVRAAAVLGKRAAAVYVVDFSLPGHEKRVPCREHQDCRGKESAGYRRAALLSKRNHQSEIASRGRPRASKA